MLKVVHCLIAAAVFGAAPAAAAQDPSVSADSDILVTGNADVEAQIRDFVAALAEIVGDGEGRQ